MEEAQRTRVHDLMHPLHICTQINWLVFTTTKLWHTHWQGHHLQSSMKSGLYSKYGQFTHARTEREEEEQDRGIEGEREGVRKIVHCAGKKSGKRVPEIYRDKHIANPQ